MTAETPRTRLSRLPGDPVSLIGHNQGPPLDPGRSWRAHCWRTARAALVPRLPIEVIRRRVLRAQELGLAYPAYASILLGSGRDVVAFLFTAEALALRLTRTVALPADRVEKLRGLARCDRLLLTGPEQDPADMVGALAAAHGVAFRGAGRAPAETAPQAEGRRALRAVLDPLRLPGDAVVVVGARACERDWAEAARMAAFLSAQAYFEQPGAAAR